MATKSIWAKDNVSDFTLDSTCTPEFCGGSFIVTKGEKSVQFMIDRFVSVAQKELFDVHYSVHNLSNEPVQVSFMSQIDADVL
ncbi:Maltose phosphorylase [Lactiplantibacillus plantarum subsp. plantarum]|uniref:Maltose phosphorylase n=1 Tax=Lactiplantibacillus plantarum subsp. plantarum TaxID=337330 RepID=A0A2S3U8K0_LACPN|nr:Maltose phosphorylase [Lactiplantibacillus plantarum subsp. plantarum]